PSARSEALNVPKGRSVEGVLITMQPGADIRGVVLNIPEGVENVRVMASARRDPQGNGNQAGIGVFNVLGGDPGELLGDMGMPFGERQVDPDREGRFVLRGLEQGLTYRLWAVQQGRGIVGGGQCTERLEVRSGTSNVELHYEAGVTVTFTVLGKGDAPVERLWVRDRLRGGNNGGFGDMMWGGFGGGRGRAQDYPGGKVTLANLRPKQGQKLQLDVDALGYLGWQKADIELPAVGALDLGPVHLSPTPLLEVEVLAADTGAPIEGARVRLSSQPREGRGGGRNPFAGWQGAGGQGPSSATTDAAGLAAVNASVDDPATLRVTAKDFASVRLDLPPNTSGAQQIKLLVGGTIEVSVLDPQQQPVANVTVEHRGADGETGEARTDEHGVARFAHQVPGEHEVRLAQDRGPMRFAMRIEGMPQAGGEAAEEPWTPVTVADKATVALTLAKAPTAKVEGVVRENGLALSGARVVFVEGPGAAAEGPEAAAFGMVQGMMEQFGQGGSKSARSGDDGTFKLAELPAGQHRLRITHKDRAMPTEIPVVLREGDNRVDVELDMTSVRGVVRDPDGNPVSGARVGAKVVSGDNQPDVGVIVESMAPGLNLGGGGGTQRTDANGEFELRGVEPGATLQVRAAARGFAPAVVTTSVARGESKVGVDLRLGAAGKIAVTVAGTPGPFSMVQARRVGKDGPEGQPSVQMLRRGKGTISDLEPGLYEVEYRSAQDLNPQNGLDGGQRKRVEVVAGETATVEF
ncbi:MAG: carboxypeptidase regulatory-like domain-containing protein, partial [Planctomycetes bacterium]|nr:carboxypeptidase regulatory-like domain-containing protein [Planctomycetota bacterium]